MTPNSRSFRAASRKLGKLVGLLVVATLVLGRCAFEGGAFSGQTVAIPDAVALSSIVDGNDGNPIVDAYMEETMKQLAKACWQSGWRRLVRTLLWTGPDAISIEVTDSILGTRTMSLRCSEL